MPRKTPTEELDVIGPIDMSPQDGVGDLIESKKQDAFFLKEPNWDSSGESVELLFVRNQREYDIMKRLQGEMTEHNKRQTLINANRIRKMYLIQSMLRKRFIEVNGFIKDCTDKRRIAEKKVIEQSKEQQELRDLIALYKVDVVEFAVFRKVLRKEVRRYDHYEKILEDVVVKSPIYDSVKDCMDRCDALMLAQVEINEMESRKMKEIENMRQGIVKMTSNAALKVLGLKNELAELERLYNHARSECLRWEQILATAKTVVADNDLNRDRALDGVHHIYRLLCRRRHREPEYQRHEVEKQLNYIKDEVELLHAVYIECKRDPNAVIDEYTERDDVKC